MYRRPSIASRLVVGIFIAGTWFCVAGPVLQPSVSAQICAESQQRNISFTAVNNEGRLIENLRKEHLGLTVDKVPMEVLTLEQKADQRLAVAILIDISLSQERVLDGTKFTAQKFVESVLTGESDRAMLVSFSGTIYVDQELTDNLAKMRAAIGRLEITIPAGYIEEV